MSKTATKPAKGPVVLAEHPPLYKKAAKGENVVWKIRVIDWEGAPTIETTWGRVGGEMQVSRDMILAGKNEGKKNATTAKEQAIAEAKAQWIKKQERKGYGLDAGAKESAAKRSISPMLAHHYEDHKKKVDWEEPVFLQRKFNGHRCLIFLDFDKGKATLRSRNGVEIVNTPHIARQLCSDWIPRLAGLGAAEELILDGELWTDKVVFQDVAANIVRKKPKEGFDGSVLDFMLYDILVDKLTYAQRWEMIQTLFGSGDGSIKVVDTYQVLSEDEAVKMALAFIDEGDHYDGGILRLDRPYEPGKRSHHLLKIKKARDLEAVIVGVKPGDKGKAQKQAKFVCELPSGARFEVLAHGPVEQKERFLKEGLKNVGRLLTIEYEAFSKDGIPLKPIAKHFRDDA